MDTFLNSSTLLITIVASLVFGIACGYAAIMGILKAFGHSSQTQIESAPATAVLAASAH